MKKMVDQSMLIIKKKKIIKNECLHIRVTEDFAKTWREFAKLNKVNTSQTIMAFLTKVMNER